MEPLKTGNRKNHRRYPGVKGRRPDFSQVRRREAQERQEAYDKLTLQEKIERLPIGGAKKQRARLEKLLKEQQAIKQES